MTLVVRYLWLGIVAASLTLSAQDEPDWIYGLEFRGHFRDSDQGRFPVPFPFPPEFLPPGATQGALETVDGGKHWEVQRLTVFAEGNLGWTARGRLKIDIVDRYDRNPTSGDNKVDVDEAWVIMGRDTIPSNLPDASGWYVKVGKFEKFERQDDRHLESYGLVSTSYNRFEDAGFEIGVDIGSNFYIKGSYTNGNPVFMRDPNALAGDNGTDELNPFVNPFPNPELKSGIVMLYDSEVEDFGFEAAETGLGVGLRFGDEYGQKSVNFLLYRYQRDLQDSVNMTGTFYGGDLDLLRGVGEEFGLTGGLPLTSEEKEETGANLWVYLHDFTLFAQYVESDIAGLKSDAHEIELSYAFELPPSWAIGGSPLFAYIAPALRYSELNPDFTGNANIFPAPSLWWRWKKRDIGLELHIYRGLEITLEQNKVEFLRAGVWESNDEFLTTFSYRWDRHAGATR